MRNLLIPIAICLVFLFCNCSNNQNAQLNPESKAKIDLQNRIFWAPAIRDFYPAYYFFYSPDSCYIRYGGNLNGFVVAYTTTETGVIVKLSDRDEHLKLLGSKLLMSDKRSYFEVSDFATAFQSN